MSNRLKWDGAQISLSVLWLRTGDGSASDLSFKVYIIIYKKGMTLIGLEGCDMIYILSLHWLVEMSEYRLMKFDEIYTPRAVSTAPFYFIVMIYMDG